VYDIDTAAEQLEADRVGGGARFRENLSTLLARLERFPESAAVYESPSPRYAGLRTAQLSKFRNHAVYYVVTPEGILVVRVLHASRNVAAIFNSDPN
jgi:plasmid stabilization system protein ParE